MSVPTYDLFIEPLLRTLAAHPEGVSVGAAYEAVANAAALSAEDRAELLPSGVQAVYKNRIGWAHDRLKRAGLSSSPKRGLWQLTADGNSFAARHSRLDEATLERLAMVDSSSRRRPAKDGSNDAMPAQAPSAPLERTSPEERIEAALSEIRESVARDLLEYIGLEKVHIQAKRWKNNVGSPELQTFVGALQLQGASKGVFITTSAFTRAQFINLSEQISRRDRAFARRRDEE